MQGLGDWPTDCNVRLPRSWPSPASSFDLLFLKPCGATVLPDTTRRFTLERSVSAWAQSLFGSGRSSRGGRWELSRGAALLSNTTGLCSLVPRENAPPKL